MGRVRPTKFLHVNPSSSSRLHFIFEGSVHSTGTTLKPVNFRLVSTRYLCIAHAVPHMLAPGGHT